MGRVYLFHQLSAQLSSTNNEGRRAPGNREGSECATARNMGVGGGAPAPPISPATATCAAACQRSQFLFVFEAMLRIQHHIHRGGAGGAAVPWGLPPPLQQPQIEAALQIPSDFNPSQK
jgi:hypothetical protein